MTRPAWRLLTPGQRALLRRLAEAGPLQQIRPWEMRTVRSLLAKGLVRPKSPDCDGRAHLGRWFLTDRARQLIPRSVSADDPRSAIVTTGSCIQAAAFTAAEE